MLRLMNRLRTFPLVFVLVATFACGVWWLYDWMMFAFPWGIVGDENWLLPVGACVAAACIWFVRASAYSRRWEHGRCTWCGYDLTTTPERCPECGVRPKN